MPPSSGEPPSSSRQLQRFCRAWAENDYWEGFIILAIFASSVALVLDTPRLDEDSDLKHVLEHSNYWFTALFTLELIIKCLAFDLLVQPDGYLLSSWNLLDLCIMVVSVISLCPEYDRLAVLRLLRVLRPLRLLSRVEGTGDCMLIAC